MSPIASDPGSAGRPFGRSYLADPPHGPLPALLLVLTLSPGGVDA